MVNGFVMSSNKGSPTQHRSSVGAVQTVDSTSLALAHSCLTEVVIQVVDVVTGNTLHLCTHWIKLLFFMKVNPVSRIPLLLVLQDIR